MSDITSSEQLAQYIAEQVASQTAALRQSVEAELRGNAASLRQLQQQLAAAQAAAAAAGGQQNNNNGMVSGVKPAKPRTYCGNLGSDPSVWLFQFEQYVEVLCIPRSNWSRLAATYLDGKAATWWRGLVKQQPGESPNGITWDDFKSGLIATFKPVNASKIARDKLAVLKQDKSVSSYNSRFTELILEIEDIHESEKLDRYIRGLKRDVKMEVEKSEPNNLAQAMKIAQRYDSISYYSRQLAYNPNDHQHNNSRDHAPMDISAINHTRNNTTNNKKKPTSPQQLSRQEFAYCQRNKLCIRCKEPGHLARNCSKPVKHLNLNAQ